MEQGKIKAPLGMGNVASAGQGPGDEDMKIKMKRKMPPPEELISHYVSKGMDSQEASLKVIEDLQKVLFRVIANNNRSKSDRLMTRKLDTINNRLAVLDMKVDSKPGYSQAFALGLASGAALNGITTFMPHLVSSLANIWNSVSSSSSSSSSS